MVFLATACSDWPRRRRDWPHEVRLACASRLASKTPPAEGSITSADAFRRITSPDVSPGITYCAAASLPRASEPHFLLKAALRPCTIFAGIPASDSEDGGLLTVDLRRPPAKDSLASDVSFILDCSYVR